MKNLKTLNSMTLYELRLLLRSKWLLNFMILLLLMAALFYFYGLKSLDADPSEVKYGLSSISSSIDTGSIDPSFFGLEEMASDEPGDSNNGKAGYDRAIAMLMNLSLWVLPIICLILGTNAIVADKEDGRLALYHTYQMPFFYYLLSKFTALCISMLVALGISYGLFGMVIAFTTDGAQFNFFTTFFLLNIFLIIIFSALSVLVGSISMTRMQGLSYALCIWSFLVIGYEFIIFSIIDWIPYAQKLNSMLVLVLSNPIESLRVWSITKLNADYIFGPEYLLIHKWGQDGSLTNYVILSSVLMIVISLVLANFTIKKRRERIG
ncbi:ABC transporter permease subunit [Schinkia azotoformans]|uniref:ABC transporter permease subunit n=1 Tax=Schinkia azotoformans TaxID=1454 RepID=UPI002E1A736F|nr:ABC transporter permease subunit [Schinkia azotoformans]MED4352086.1 ABC transporter permease subunit [Schinkia azotoformans]